MELNEENDALGVQNVPENASPAVYVTASNSKANNKDEFEEVTFMQRKRHRSPSPRRRRRERAQRMQNRSRQENRRHWTRDPARAPVTSTSSTARAPWHRGSGRGLPALRPSAAPRTCAGTSSGAAPIPRLTGEGSGNILWWSEIVGLQDPWKSRRLYCPRRFLTT